MVTLILIYLLFKLFLSIWFYSISYLHHIYTPDTCLASSQPTTTGYNCHSNLYFALVQPFMSFYIFCRYIFT